MPAEAHEVQAAEDEGVKFLMLTNPVEYRGEEFVREVVVEIMELGEPDASGRRKPVGTGKTEVLEFDMVIAAISQVPDVECLKSVEFGVGSEELNRSTQPNHSPQKTISLSKWDTAIVDEQTMYTNVANIFAGGDFRRGPSTAVEGIADGYKAAKSIDLFLQGIPFEKNSYLFNARKEKALKHIDPRTYEVYAKVCRKHVAELSIKQRELNFDEVESCFTDEQAKAEATRCVECKCSVNETCALRKYATKYEVKIEDFTGDKNKHPIDDSHPFIRRDENKCIKCSRCVRVCSEIHGLGVLGLIYRGFGTTVAPEMGKSLNKTSCDDCMKCVEVCPTGGLVRKEL